MRKLLVAAAELALPIWLGAVASTAFIVAPAVFDAISDRTEAGRLMAPIFRGVDYVGIVAGLCFVAAAWGRKLRVVAGISITVCAAVNVWIVAPRIAARGEDFDFYHRLAEGLWGAILVVGLILAAFGPQPRKR